MRTGRTWHIVTVAGLTLASIWTGLAHADFFCSEAVKLPNVNAGGSNLGGSISADGLSLYFVREQEGNFTIYEATRSSEQDDWYSLKSLPPAINGPSWDHVPSISPDGLSLLFPSDRPGGSGGLDIWLATRSTPDSAWDTPVNLGPTVNSSAWDMGAKMSADGLSIYFHSARPGSGGEDIWMTTRAAKDAPWGPARNLGLSVNSPYNDGEPTLSADGLTLFFNSDRPGGSGSYDLWVTTRRTTSDPWGPPANLGPIVNSPAIEWCASVSADGSTLYFCSDRPQVWGPCSIYQTAITPIVDFNGDGKVDATEVQILLANWGQDEPLCDIGPTALGDGIVNMQDLAVLTQYATQDVVDPTLAACWAFDEIEGTVACDAAGMCDGLLLGEPVWQPDAGAVGGAIQLDGIDDHVTTPLFTDPCKDPFSLFAWVKGGKPGQVIFSQRETANWLLADATGALMTDLRSPGRLSRPLSSQVGITDGNWHRIGLTWDGSTRSLYSGRCLCGPGHAGWFEERERRPDHRQRKESRRGQLLVRPDRRCPPVQAGDQTVNGKLTIEQGRRVSCLRQCPRRPPTLRRTEWFARPMTGQRNSKANPKGWQT